MASIRLTSFLLRLGFICLIIGNSPAYTHQVMENMDVANDISSTFDKKIFDAAPTAAEDGIGRVGGRKMMEKRVLVGRGMVNEGASKIAGAAHSVGNYNHKGKGRLTVDASPDHPGNVKMIGFVAFSADYHVPKPHPPKNN